MISKISTGIAMLLASATLFVSCQKEKANGGEQAEPQELRLSGVTEEDPAIMAKVPVIVSANYMARPNDREISEAKGKPDNISPSVTISSPMNGANVSGQVNIVASATDNNGVTLVNFSVDGVLIGSRNAAPFTLPWNSASVPNGNHTVNVMAKDAAGNSKSVSIVITTNNVSGSDVTAPTVSITSPSTGSSVSGTVNIQAGASDNVGVSNVAFRLDGTVIGNDNSAPYSVALNTSSLAAGSHTIQVTATDAAGNNGLHSVQVTVNTVVLPPTNLPSSQILVTPPVRSQGSEFSCVAFAAGYAARSIEEYYKTGATGYNNSNNLFSPEYLYNQTKAFDYCSSGTGIVKVLEFLKTQGICTWQSMPYSDLNGCTLLPNASQSSEAANFKISNYSAISKADITAIKTMIVNKHPIILTVNLDESFTNAQPGFIWQSYAGSGGFSHALIICGYDDSKNAFKVMNSWGTGWGDAGYSWINYSFLAQTGGQWVFAVNV